jgi:hypothetical protein
MPSIAVRTGIPEQFEDVLSLFVSVGWTAYTRDPETLRRGMPSGRGSADEPGQQAFYEHLGYSEVHAAADGRLRAFLRFG